MQEKNEGAIKDFFCAPLKRRLDTEKPQWLMAASPISYPDALSVMDQRVEEIVTGAAPELVWSLEHPHVYTLGTSGQSSEVLRLDVPFFETGRGGKATYHGPGQRVVYVMLDLRARTQDLRAYVWHLEEWLIKTLCLFDIETERREGRVGLWVTDRGHEKKIAAIGVRVRKWITFHGIALNVAPDISYFQGIIPCGLSQYGVTSIADLRPHVTADQVDAALYKTFFQVF
ncbi:MAG: lipoyl(octanoyl) transferase LipB [Alphaproteobacteria bacterium]|nr:lipoyl(octanoyl) transferase LipB [Alphaproteobacteria bacterium]